MIRSLSDLLPMPGNFSRLTFASCSHVSPSFPLHHPFLVIAELSICGWNPHSPDPWKLWRSWLLQIFPSAGKHEPKLWKCGTDRASGKIHLSHLLAVMNSETRQWTGENCKYTDLCPVKQPSSSSPSSSSCSWLLGSVSVRVYFETVGARRCNSVYFSPQGRHSVCSTADPSNLYLLHLPTAHRALIHFPSLKLWQWK